MIQIRNLTKCFGELKAVDDLTLDIAQGELFAFLGPNAAGKTTTIKLLAGLLRPTSGSCVIGGHDVQREPEAAKRLLAYGLDAYRHELTENLSHGTRQRLVIASALLHNPKVLIIDEPMVGLDPMHARTVKDELKERSRAGTTIFLSTHQLGIAEELADRIGIIGQGRLIALGTLEELRRQTAGGALEGIFLSLIEGEEAAGVG
jgi:ABC-2 type transport system ATP-binding protein